MRSRNIKPGFWRNDEIVELPFEDRLLFIGLWNLADREGRIENRPKKIKLEIFPADNVDVALGITRLSEAGLVKVYQAKGIKCISVINFKKHQNPHHREAASVLPAPDERKEKEHITDEKHLQVTDLKGASESPRLAHDHTEESPRSAVLIPDSLNLIPDSLQEHTDTPRSLFIMERFNKFYESYPVKKSKGAAEKSFKKLNPDDLMLSKMLKAIRLQSEHREKLKAANQFTPDWKHPATWLNQRCWEDVLEPVTTGNRKPNTSLDWDDKTWANDVNEGLI